ncbi:hypothetical protein [Micromonospora fulviviridis]|uniref:WXG100 family type VII secretion target n=1 Tax=Micromonospora fulviviridis TaxID=47860 RepID=A0ABV2VHC6_9ACTN
MAVDYNKATDGSSSNLIDVDPLILWQKCQKVLNYLELIVKELTEIGNKWENIQLRWQGPDATTAQDFVNQLQAAFTALFGPAGTTDISDLKSGEGSLIKLSAGISMASRNYGAAEASVREMMMSFAHALGQESSGGRSEWEGVETLGPLSEYRGFGQDYVP